MLEFQFLAVDAGWITAHTTRSVQAEGKCLMSQVGEQQVLVDQFKLKENACCCRVDDNTHSTQLLVN